MSWRYGLWVGLMAGILGAGSDVPAAGQGCQIEVKRRQDSPWPATVATVDVWPCGLELGEAYVDVISAAGTRVGSQVMWQAPGEPLTVRFDCSAGDTSYRVRVFPEPPPNNPPVPVWRGKAGLTLETRRRVSGEATTGTETLALWQRCTPVQGRGEVAMIHHAINPYAATEDFAARYDGWLSIPKDGRYGFATLSDDASFLLIDGKEVASWGGWHDIRGGQRAEHRGYLDLRRGVHRIEYYNVQSGPSFMVTAAWQTPGHEAFETIPAKAFVPVAIFDQHRVRLVDAAADAAAFRWRTKRHARAGSYEMVEMALRLVEPRTGVSYTWHFDDGLTDVGESVEHIFSCSGVQPVRVEARRGRQVIGTLTQSVHVHPHWSQRADFPQATYDALKGRVLELDLTAMRPADLAGYVALAYRVEDQSFMAALGTLCLPRAAEFTESSAKALYRLGFHYQHAEVRQYAQAERAWRALLAIEAIDPELHARTRVHLAGYLIHGGERVGEGLTLLEGTLDEILENGDVRLKLIYMADAMVLLDRLEAARALYRQAGTISDSNDPVYTVKRRARLELARNYLARGEYEAAEGAIRELEWEWPLERLDLETGLVMVGVNMGRQEYPFARAGCHRLLKNAAVNRYRAEVLLRLAETCVAMDRRSDALQALGTLKRDHPYSEAAASASAALAPLWSQAQAEQGSGD